MQNVHDIVRPGGEVFVAGRGIVDLEEESRHKALAKVIATHDPDNKLTIGRHKDTGEWVLFLRPKANPFGIDAPYPLLGMGKELPSPELIERILVETDTRRSGDKILNDITAANERVRKPARSHADEAIERLAEAAESYMNAHGQTPYYRSTRNLDLKNRPYRKDAD